MNNNLNLSTSHTAGIRSLFPCVSENTPAIYMAQGFIGWRRMGGEDERTLNLFIEVEKQEDL